MSTPSELMTSAEVAAMCRVVQDTVRKWRKAGHLPAAGRTPKGWLFRRADVERFLRDGGGAVVVADDRPMIVRAQVDALLARRRAGA